MPVLTIAQLLEAASADSFETAMLRVGGVLTKRLDEMPALEQAVRRVGKAFGMTADEVAQGAFQLASFGYGQRQTAGMLPGVSVLARAGAGETGGAPDFERASEAIGRSLLVWRMGAGDATRVANVIAVRDIAPISHLSAFAAGFIEEGSAFKAMTPSGNHILCGTWILDNKLYVRLRYA